jgi:hypothetical protein
LLEKLRDEGHHLPAIMITGNADVPMAVKAMKAGALDFIEKPIVSTCRTRNSNSRWGVGFCVSRFSGTCARQGAVWPVDVVVIDGKGKSDWEPLTKRLLKTWDEVGAK